MNIPTINNKNLYIAILISAVALLLFSVGWLGVDIKNKFQEGKFIGLDVVPQNTITVSGTGEVSAKPNLAITAFSVVVEAKTVIEAMADNTQKMNSVIESIKKEGIEEKDLKTTSFNIYPRYEYQRVETEFYPYPPGKRVLVGYEINQSLEVKIRKMDNVGKILELAVNAGANQVGDLRFTIEKEDDLKAEARKQAIDKARAKAKQLASQLGVKLGGVINFNESGTAPIFYGFKEAAVGMGGAAPQIQTGENKIEATVSITYLIK